LLAAADPPTTPPLTRCAARRAARHSAALVSTPLGTATLRADIEALASATSQLVLGLKRGASGRGATERQKRGRGERGVVCAI
jgi:hypothetical protein